MKDFSWILFGSSDVGPQYEIPVLNYEAEKRFGSALGEIHGQKRGNDNKPPPRQ
jgi:hypothetical protein